MNTPEQALLEQLNTVLDAHPSTLDKLASEISEESTDVAEAPEAEAAAEAAVEEAAPEAEEEALETEELFPKEASADQMRTLLEHDAFAKGVSERIGERQGELETALGGAYDRLAKQAAKDS
jgi:predicted  nucleic acid-binding Zn-ribbon protein